MKWKENQIIAHIWHTCEIPEGSKLAKPCEPVDREAVDEAVKDQDGAIDGQHDVLGGHVAAAIGSAGAEQDDHLDELRQGEIHARGASPLCGVCDRLTSPIMQESRAR